MIRIYTGGMWGTMFSKKLKLLPVWIHFSTKYTRIVGAIIEPSSLGLLLDTWWLGYLWKFLITQPTYQLKKVFLYNCPNEPRLAESNGYISCVKVR